MAVYPARKYGKMSKQISLKHKMVIGGIAAVVIPFIITAGIIYVQLSGYLMKIARESAIHISGDIAREIENFLDQESRLLSSIAANPDIVHASRTGDYTIAAHELEAVFKSVAWNKTTMFLTDRNGIIKFDPRFPQQQGLDLSDREYFKKAKNGQTSVSDPLYARGTSDYDIIVVLCTPIQDDQEVLGTAAMVFSTDFLVDIMSRPALGYSGYAFLLNKEGLVLMHPEEELILKRSIMEFLGIQDIKTVMDSGRPGIASYIYKGQKKMAGLSHVKHAGWTAAYAQTLDEIMAPVNRLLTAVFISGVLFLIITIFIIYIFFQQA